MYHTDLSKFRFAHPLSRAEESRTVRAARAGDAEAYALLYDRFQLVQIRSCRKLARGWMDGDDADDIQSEATLALAEAIQSFKPRKGARFVTWLYFVTRRRVLGYLVKRTKLSGPAKTGTAAMPADTLPADADPAWLASRPEEEPPPEAAYRVEIKARIAATLARWSEKDRKLVLRRVEDGWTFDRLGRFLPPGGPGGRREASPRFRTLLERLRTEVLR